jgi:hypothetical protein
MFGWFREDAALASLWKRLRAWESLASSSGRNFRGDVATELEVFRLVHNTHTTPADFAQYAVMGDRLPDGLGGRGHWLTC